MKIEDCEIVNPNWYVEPSQIMSCGTTIIWEDEPAKVKFKVDGDKFKWERDLVFLTRDFLVLFWCLLRSVEFDWRWDSNEC